MIVYCCIRKQFVDIGRWWNISKWYSESKTIWTILIMCCLFLSSLYLYLISNLFASVSWFIIKLFAVKFFWGGTPAFLKYYPMDNLLYAYFQCREIGICEQNLVPFSIYIYNHESTIVFIIVNYKFVGSTIFCTLILIEFAHP